MGLIVSIVNDLDLGQIAIILEDILYRVDSFHDWSNSDDSGKVFELSLGYRCFTKDDTGICSGRGWILRCRDNNS